MKISSKVLSIVLVLVLALSVMIIPASAAPDGSIELTYKLEKYEGLDTNGAVGTDIYGLTMYINSTNPITNFTMPIYYERDKFLPVDGTDMSLLDWEYTVDHPSGCPGVAYVIPENSELADTNKYKKENVIAADRTVVTRGGISALGSLPFQTYIKALTDQDKDTSTAWWVSADPEKYGCFIIQYESSANYCNVQGFGEARPFLTFLFKAQTTEIDGAYFGPLAEGQEAVFVTETDNTKFYYDATSTVGYPAINNVGYTYSYTAPASPVKEKSAQIRFNGTETAGTGSANFDVRTRAYISKADLATILGVTEAEVETAAKAAGATLQVGFVYQATSAGAFDIEAAKAAATAGATTGTYFVKPVTYVQRSGSDYVWTCLITGADYADGVDSLAYINYNGTMYFLDAPASANFGSLYGTYYPQYVASLS